MAGNSNFDPDSGETAGKSNVDPDSGEMTGNSNVDPDSGETAEIQMLTTMHGEMWGI